jgi:hypothetical protein
MTDRIDPLVMRALDGDLPLEALPPALRAEAEAARRVFGASDRAPVSLSPGFDARVMAAVRARGARRSGGARRALTWLVAPRELRVVVRPWMAGALAAAAALVVLVARPEAPAPDGVAVRFVLHAPEAQTVGLAGTFNQWDSGATPLVRSEGGLWAATLVLPAGEHEYAFVVDGERWVPDPAAPGVDDGFGRRNSVLTLSDAGRAM